MGQVELYIRKMLLRKYISLCFLMAIFHPSNVFDGRLKELQKWGGKYSLICWKISETKYLVLDLNSHRTSMDVHVYQDLTLYLIVFLSLIWESRALVRVYSFLPWIVSLLNLFEPFFFLQLSLFHFTLALKRTKTL